MDRAMSDRTAGRRAPRHEQMRGGPPVDGAQHASGLKRDARARTVAEKRKWDRQQRLEGGLQGRHQGVQMRDRHLPHALPMTREFYGTEIDNEGHARPPRAIEKGVSWRGREPARAQSGA